MNAQNLGELLFLAAIWGASFLFMRISVPYFGPIPLVALRVGIAALFLSPVFLRKNAVNTPKPDWFKIFWLGLLNSALPFSLFAYATSTLTAGYASILNATAPLWSAFIAFFWLKNRLSPTQKVGLFIGFLGVVYLVVSRKSVDFHLIYQQGLAILAALLATLAYGFSANYTKQYLSQMDPLAIAAGSQLAATVWMFPLAIIFWPSFVVPPSVWLATLLIGILCTAIAYVLFFRLINQIGPAKTMTVTFLIPIFGLFWGWLFLKETLTLSMVIGCIIIFCGVGLTFRPSIPLRKRSTK